VVAHAGAGSVRDRGARRGGGFTRVQIALCVVTA
jgi:hypothetical protein